MRSHLISSFFQIIITVIFSLFFVKNFDIKTIKSLGLIGLFFFGMSFFLFLPFEYNWLNFTNTNWNFSGKIFSIFFSILFFLLFLRKKTTNNFVKFSKGQKIGRSLIIVFIILILFAVLDGLLFGSPQNIDNEKLIYQLVLPGIDEELAYRGILLGLFSYILIYEIKVYSFKINPSILITAILFGLIHGLKVTENLELSFNVFITCKTFIYGFFWGWLTVETKSVLIPIFFHNYSNVIPMLIRSFLNN